MSNGKSNIEEGIETLKKGAELGCKQCALALGDIYGGVYKFNHIKTNWDLAGYYYEIGMIAGCAKFTNASWSYCF